MWPVSSFVLLFVVCRIHVYLSSLTLCNTSSFLTRSVKMFSAFLQRHISKFPGIFDLLSEMSKFHRHTKLCSKCSSLLVSSLNLSLICWWKDPSFCWMKLGHGNPQFNWYLLHHLFRMLPKSWNIPHSPVVLDPYSVLEVVAVIFPLATLLSYTFISSPQNLQISVSLSNMSCSTVSFLDISTSLSTYIIVPITCPPDLKSPTPSTAFFVRYSLYKVNKIGARHHHALSPPPIVTLLVSPWSNLILTLWFMYNLLINFLSRRSVPVPFRIRSNLV